MKPRLLVAALFLIAVGPASLSLGQSKPAPALNGEPYIHDPSTIVLSDGK